jgi:hypothetical protein
MAKGWLSFLSLGERIAAPFIRLGVSLGRTLAEIGSSLTRAGAGIEARTIRRIMEAEQTERRVAEQVLGPSPDHVPDPAGIPEAITRQRREYAWRIRMGFIDPRTGKRESRMLTVSTDQLLSPNEAKETAAKMLADDYDIKGDFIIESELIGVTRAAPGRRL